MNKKIIGIEVNEILRARSMQFDRYYAQEFGGEGLPDDDDPYKYDLRNDYLWESGYEVTKFLREDIPEDISPLDYQVDPKTGKAPVDDIAFTEEKKYVSADEKFKRFLYQDYLLEIFGLAPPLYKNLSLDFEKFYYKFKDQFEIKVVSKENWFTVPPTLYFLGKNGCRVNNYSFVDKEEELWDTCDILITTDPKLLDNIPEGKRAVKILRPYNVDNTSDGIFETEKLYQIKDLIDNKDFHKFIGYVKPVEKENVKKETSDE